MTMMRFIVIITSGASGAIAIAIPALADAGHNILVPRPGFSLYATVCGHYGIECRYYDLLPERSWELDLLNMSKLVLIPCTIAYICVISSCNA
jgi:tyrosine aminotransferase